MAAARSVIAGAMAGALLAGMALGLSPARAQGAALGLRGEDDPFQRVGRTAGEAGRNPSSSPRRPQAAPAAQRSQRRRAEAATRAVLPELESDPVARIGAPRIPARRPAQQNFRSLERPPNAAVPTPGPDAIVNQGLATPTPPNRVRGPAVDPYAPLGLRTGTLLVFPTIDVLGGYDSNPERRSGQRRGSTYGRIEGGLTLRSDWARHDLSADIRGGYNRYLRAPDANRPDGSGRVNLRLDYSRDTAFDFELRGRADTEAPGTANLTGQAEGRPLVLQYGGSAGATQRFNRLALSVRGGVDRADYADASLGQGQVLSQKDRNFTQYSMRARAAYEVTPGFVPFADALVDTRRYDLATDNAGFARDSDGLQLRAGMSFEITRTLTGEIAAGYGMRRFEDQRLRSLGGPVVEGTLAWSVSPLTSVRLRGTTEFEETTQAGSSGAITRRLSAELSHAFLRNLVFNAGGSYGRADYNGIDRRDDTLRASLGVDFSMTRNIVLRGSFQHEKTTSNVAGNDVSANVWLFGVRTQF